MPPKASAVTAQQPSLDTWLSVSSTAATTNSNTNPAPALITHSPPLLDKDSIFLASAFPLTAPPTNSNIQTLINLHLSPPRAEGLPKAVEFGKGVMPSHRMYAWRYLALKKGRRSTGGPEDWEIQEGSDDDDEKYGGDRLLSVMRKLGAVDCILFCCRWFGGTLLGPIRFQHIETSGSHALSSHLKLADLQPFLVELGARDARITQLRSVLPPPPSSISSSASSSTPVKAPKAPDYSRIDQKKAERLLVARQKTIEGLEKKVEGLKEIRRKERAKKSGEGLKRAAEAILVEDDVGQSSPAKGKGKERETELPTFKKRRVQDDEVQEVIQLDEDDTPPPEPTLSHPPSAPSAEPELDERSPAEEVEAATRTDEFARRSPIT